MKNLETLATLKGDLLELQHTNRKLVNENKQLKKQLNIQNGIYYGS